MSELLKPPTVPSAILNFFSGQPDFSAVMGDLDEEFQQRVTSSDARAARLWYWRQTLRNAMALTVRELLRTPIRTIFVALCGALTVNAVTLICSLSIALTIGHLHPFRKIIDITFDQRQNHALLLLQFVAALALGWVNGRLLPGREWALALMYSLVFLCWPAGVGVGVAVSLWHPGALLLFDLPYPRGILILGFLFRLGAFWIGCLWLRHDRGAAGQDATRSR